MTWLYLVQAAYNLEALVSLLVLSFQIQWNHSYPKIAWASTVRGDFREMAVHHVVTNLLVLASSYLRFTRIGSMVFLVHDLSDVPVDLSKLANFLKWRNTTVLCFVTMVLLWFFTRLVILPFVIIRSVLFESYLLVTASDCHVLYYYGYRIFFYILFGIIQLLHILWFLMFLRMGWLILTKSELHDLSEHKKGEPQTTMPSKKLN